LASSALIPSSAFQEYLGKVRHFSKNVTLFLAPFLAFLHGAEIPRPVGVHIANGDLLEK
jgi:hypothetical protein